MIGTQVDKAQIDLKSNVSLLVVLRPGVEGRSLSDATARLPWSLPALFQL
jgi:hypothetical protein